MSDSGSISGGTFFGLIVKPNKRYDTVVQDSFRVTKACIEPSTAADKVTSLFLEHDAEEFIVANLDKKNLNEDLDIAFTAGEKIGFKVEGPGVVHLTGNLIVDDEANFDGGMWSDDSDGGSETEMTEADTPETKSKKRKNGEAKKQADAKKIKLDSSNGKADDEESSDDDDSDDSSSDEETDADTTTGADTTNGGDTTTLSDLDSTANYAEEAESDSDEDGEEEESDDDDDDESDETSSPPKQNGDVSPSKKAKLEAKEKTPAKPVNENKKPKTPNGEATPKHNKASKEEKPQKPHATPKTDKAAAKPIETPKADKTPKPEKTPKSDKNVEKTPKPNATPKSDKTPKPDKTPKSDAPKTPKETKTPKDMKTPKGEAADEVSTPKSVKKNVKGGVAIEDIKVGTGQEAKFGKKVGMYYRGWLQKNNKQFDSCLKGKPFKFKLGAGEVIKGWDIGVAGMKVGGKRKLTIPPNMAYGSEGAMPDIPPNSTLMFEIECKYTT